MSRFLHHLHDGQEGVSLVELLVAMGIFMLFSSMFAVSAIQLIRSTNEDAVRSRSASQILNATQRIAGVAHKASDVSVSDDGDTVYLYVPASAVDDTSATSTGAHAQCVRLLYTPGSGFDGTVTEATADVTSSSDITAASCSTYIDASVTGTTILTGMQKDPDGVFAPKSTGSATSFTFDPVVGSTVSGKTVTSSTRTSFTVRNG